MNEEEWSPRDEGEREELVKRFESMVTRNESWFFDIDQFETMLEYYLENGKFKQAEKLLAYAKELYPESTALLLREAQLYANTGKLSKAIPKLTSLLNFEPHNEEILLTLASIHSQLREHKKAIFYLKRALELGEGEFRDDIYLELALEYENLEQWDLAIETLNEALRSNPENETALHELAYCFDMSNKVEESIAFFNAFLDEDPYSFSAWYILGNIYLKQERAEEAVDAFGFCLAIEDEFTPGILNLASAYVKLEKYERAISCYFEILQYEPPQAMLLCYIGECYERLDKLEEAEEYYRKSIALDDTFSDAYVGMGVVADLKDEHGAALRYFEHALRFETESTDIMSLIASTLKKMGLNEEAISVYEGAVHLENDNEELWLDYSDVYARQLNFNMALITLQDGMAYIKDSTELKYREVTYRYHNGERKEAYALLESLLADEYEKSQSLLEYSPELMEDQVVIQLMETYKP
ncbi:MAG: hypothetical protein RL226_2162 [Bacteroidota bacterium]